MALFDRLKRSSAASVAPGSAATSLSSSWCQYVPSACRGRRSVRGESYRQDVLRAELAALPGIAATTRWVVAELRPEPRNVHDSNAVAVLLGGRQVGYLAREETGQFAAWLARHAALRRPALCRAILTGGTSSKPSIGVMLMVDPFDQRESPVVTLWPDHEVTVTGEENHAEGLSGAPLDTELVAQLLNHQGLVYVGLGGQWVGRFTAKMSDRYVPLLTEVTHRDLPLTCVASVSLDKKDRRQVTVFLPDVRTDPV